MVTAFLHLLIPLFLVASQMRIADWVTVRFSGCSLFFPKPDSEKIVWHLSKRPDFARAVPFRADRGVLYIQMNIQ
jgi:hypothetical protein